MSNVFSMCYNDMTCPFPPFDDYHMCVFCEVLHRRNDFNVHSVRNAGPLTGGRRVVVDDQPPTVRLQLPALPTSKPSPSTLTTCAADGAHLDVAAHTILF